MTQPRRGVQVPQYPLRYLHARGPERARGNPLGPGHSDMEVFTRDRIYIFEFQYGSDPIPAGAIAQIREKGYPSPYAAIPARRSSSAPSTLPTSPPWSGRSRQRRGWDRVKGAPGVTSSGLPWAGGRYGFYRQATAPCQGRRSPACALSHRVHPPLWYPGSRQQKLYP